MANALRLLATAALCGSLHAHAQTPKPPEPGLGADQQEQTLTATARLRYWGFDVYDAVLHAPPGFDAQRFESQRFSLELRYLRGFKGADIAERSIDEMKALATLEPAQAQRWHAAMVATFPDVQRGDRLTGVHVPGQGARFYLGTKPIGEIADDAFSRLFFGIWLSPRTSQPRLREMLLGSLNSGPPRTP